MDRRIDTEYWEVIWKTFKAGDRDAFRTIYNEFVDALFSYGYKITSDRDLVKDSIQDLFLDIYSYGSILRKPESLEFYLFKTLKRIIIRKLIDQKKYTSEQEMKNIFELNFIVEDDLSSEELEDKLSFLQNELSQLKPDNRELLFLKFNSGLTYQEIGNLLEIKPNTVKKQVYRILSQLRKRIAHEIVTILLMCWIT